MPAGGHAVHTLEELGWAIVTSDLADMLNTMAEGIGKISPRRAKRRGRLVVGGARTSRPGTTTSGMPGLILPMPPGLRYYLVAGRNFCGIGPK